jgi:hypothetical protein
MIGFQCRKCQESGGKGLKAYPATGPQIGGEKLEAEIKAFFLAVRPGSPPGGD